MEDWRDRWLIEAVGSVAPQGPWHAICSLIMSVFVHFDRVHEETEQACNQLISKLSLLASPVYKQSSQSSFCLKQALCDGTARSPIICADASLPSSVTLPVLCPPPTPSSSPTKSASERNTLFQSIYQHVLSRPHRCVCHGATALAHGIATPVISGQVLCH